MNVRILRKRQMSDIWSQVLSFVLGALAGSGITIYMKSQKASGDGNVVDQSNVTAKGDVVGRDKRA